MNQIRADALVAMVEHFLATGPDYRGLQALKGTERCQVVLHVDAHHIQHWAEGGETRLDNLVTLCRFHHRQLHRGCFDIRLNGNSAEILVPEEF